MIHTRRLIGQKFDNVFQYNQQPIPEFDLDDFATIEEVEEGFRRMKLSNGATNTGKESVQENLTSNLVHLDAEYKQHKPDTEKSAKVI